MLAIGKLIGGLTLLLVLAQVAIGFLRARIDDKFHSIHKSVAIVLLLCAAIHGTLLFLKWGPPRTAWHLCGTAGATLAFLALVIGFAKRHLGAKFLTTHQIVAVVALTCALLHRILAFI